MVVSLPVVFTFLRFFFLSGLHSPPSSLFLSIYFPHSSSMLFSHVLLLLRSISLSILCNSNFYKWFGRLYLFLPLFFLSSPPPLVYSPSHSVPIRGSYEGFALFLIFFFFLSAGFNNVIL